MNETCGCCAGVSVVTPQSLANRPGLSRLTYRVGTHATFLATMQARLSGQDQPKSLAGLATRELDDPAIALLDGWATVADVLSFYQERIANEGYLRTATERRSILELARLVGYELKPGVAASVFLAYTLDPSADAIIPAGHRTQTLPGPGEKVQSFETSDALTARAEWNAISPRTTRPQDLSRANVAELMDQVYFQGTALNLKPNDRLLFVLKDGKTPSAIPRRIQAVEVDKPNDRTKVQLQGMLSVNSSPASRLPEAGKPALKQVPPAGTGQTMQNGGTSTQAGSPAAAAKDSSFLRAIGALQKPLSLAPALYPATSQRLLRSKDKLLGPTGDARARMLTDLLPNLDSRQLYSALANFEVSPPATTEVYAFRKRAFVFGSNAQPQVTTKTTTSPPASGGGTTATTQVTSTSDTWLLEDESPAVVSLDAVYDQILPGSWIILEKPKDVAVGTANEIRTPVITQVQVVSDSSRSDYGITTKGTQVTLNSNWLYVLAGEGIPDADDFSTILGTTVYAQSELLPLADEIIDPIANPVQGATIELDGLYDGLDSGRWLIVTGERLIAGTSGVKDSELVMLDHVEQQSNDQLPGDTLHTTLVLADNGLAYQYKLDTVAVNANVVRATHGQTQNEVLGSGDGSQPLQSFVLRQSPLTYVSAVTTDGTQTTLQVFVNDIEWTEQTSLVHQQPTSRVFVTQTGDDDKTTVIFGDGVHGARLPTGLENVRAQYRTGIGTPGNARAGQISLLATKPLGVRGVTNPLPATGGADREERDEARRNTSRMVTPLGRLVSVQDYEDFARTYAGIGKASASRRPGKAGGSTNGRLVVHLTVAGAAGNPILMNSDLYNNLLQALAQFGDPAEPVELETCGRMLLIIQAQVHLLAGQTWEGVEPNVRLALTNAFGFDARAIGQPAFLSEVIQVIQGVAGVDSTNVIYFAGATEKDVLSPLKIASGLGVATAIGLGAGPAGALTATGILQTAAPRRTRVAVNPDQIAYLAPTVQDTLILTVQDS